MSALLRVSFPGLLIKRKRWHLPDATCRSYKWAPIIISASITTLGLQLHMCHVQRCLNIAAARCTCLEYQTYRFPCKDVFAALQATRGDAWITVVKTFNVYVDTCFQLDPNLAMVMETAIAPDMEMLNYMRD
jgi:hypothetical protein